MNDLRKVVRKIWESNDDLGGTIGNDYDILFARGRGIGGCTPGATVLCLGLHQSPGDAPFQSLQDTDTFATCP